MTDYVRRPALMSPGTPLLLCDTLRDATVRFQSFSELSGIPQDQVVATPLCGMPLPRYDGHPAGTHPSTRWSEVRADFMWHPLMWLPRRLASRYVYIDSHTGDTVTESDEMWAIRMAMELTSSGLYDIVSGTWLDILDTVGIDVDNDADLARVQDWLRFAPDEDLDGIDLEEYLTVTGRPDWALEVAVDLFDDLQRSSWAVIADELMEMTEAYADLTEMISDDERLAGLGSVSSLGKNLLGAVPNVSEDDFPTADGQVETHRDFFERVNLAASSGMLTREALMHTLGLCANRFLGMREAYWPYLEGLHEMTSSQSLSAYAPDGEADQAIWGADTAEADEVDEMDGALAEMTSAPGTDEERV